MSRTHFVGFYRAHQFTVDLDTDPSPAHRFKRWLVVCGNLELRAENRRLAVAKIEEAIDGGMSRSLLNLVG